MKVLHATIPLDILERLEARNYDLADKEVRLVRGHNRAQVTFVFCEGAAYRDCLESLPVPYRPA